ncbi:MAG: hypothetical protein EBR82_19245 [Caulobacteraceae bacterium]|nr:hypothetical protein [Caulobacteraceae bacterium]
MIQGAPPDAQRDPQGYYYWLVSNGFPHNVAYDEMVKEFGPPKTKEEQEREAAKKQQQAELAQVGGVVGGTALTGWVMDGMNMPKMPDWLKNIGKQTPTPTAPTATPSAPTPTAPMTPTSGAPNAGASSFAQNFTPVDPGSIPSGQPVPDGMTAIRSNVDGSIQVVPTESLSDSNFLSDIDWGKAGQAGMGVLQLYQAYNMAKNKEYAGAGIYGAGGAANIAASGYAGAAAQTAATDALGGYLVPGANLLMGAYGAYKTAELTGNMAAGKQRNVGAATSGAMTGAAIGSVIPVIGTGIGAAIGAAAGYLGSAAFGSKKGKAQFMRDNIRGVLQQGGVLDDKFQGTLADGTKYDFGKDGSTLKWKEIDKIAAEKPKAWGGAVPLADALAASYGFVGQKASDIAAWYAKGAVSNAGDDAGIAQKNMQHFAKQQGITYDMIKTKLDEAMKDNRISQSQYDYYLGGARQLTSYSGKPSQTNTTTPAPRPEATAPTRTAEAPEQGTKKMSVGDVLRRNIKK